MCVKIIKNECEIEYNPSRPLEEQIKGSTEVIVNYQPSDKSINDFLAEVQRYSKVGISAELNIKVIHNNDISGFKLRKQLKKALNDIKLNEIIKIMVISHTEMDDKLGELASKLTGKRK